MKMNEKDFYEILEDLDLSLSLIGYNINDIRDEIDKYKAKIWKNMKEEK